MLSGGAKGSEATFGEMAERYGMTEVCFSFAGRTPLRTRGLVELAPDDLRRGAVSSLYVESQLHRTFPADEAFQKVLQTIWHQVTTAGEVFVIGAIQEDGTVRGGTGWAAELAKRFEKPLYVFDQGRQSWLTWSGSRWVNIAAPTIRHTRFCGTGTVRIEKTGRQAIAQLFADSFGKRE
ncbi:MAG: hypothetical protein A2289_14945 [Deltaproteobacteria bacterium RIFOXYA12_FULL_58_15]|nr:MAG: hypothetical protein A2289_14945 [Deltaproteobacteria bacterium RIFOXYA12_FULL_58_15]OGR09771.1 MAG: hypothetical protein A2341_13105 [Deltaproteobacteria bacterium RIFOXYB12_FULL_58_9]